MSKGPTVAGEDGDEVTAKPDRRTRAIRQRDEIRDLVQTMEQRGHYVDIERLRRDKPQLLHGVQKLISYKAPVRDICDLLKVSEWTVKVVRDDPTCSNERAAWKDEMVGGLKWMARLTAEGLTKKAVKGTLGMFDLDMMLKNIALLEGGATQRVEIKHSIMNPATSATLRLLEAAVVNPALTDGEERVAAGMGYDAQKLHALPLEAEVIPKHKDIRENEVSPPNIEREL